MGKLLLGIAIGIVIGALVKPVAGWVKKGYLWFKAWIKSNRK